MDSIVIYKVGEAKKHPNNATLREQVAENLAKSRVQRPTLAEHFISGEAYKMDTLPSDERSTPALRQHRGSAQRCGFILPTEELGRTGRADRSVANSVRLWIEKNLGPVVNVSDFLIVAEPIED
jgi:hypothetical protein